MELEVWGPGGAACGFLCGFALSDRGFGLLQEFESVLLRRDFKGRYWGTSLTRKRPPPQEYNRALGIVCRALGGGIFLCARYPCAEASPLAFQSCVARVFFVD